MTCFKLLKLFSKLVIFAVLLFFGFLGLGIFVRIFAFFVTTSSNKSHWIGALWTVSWDRIDFMGRNMENGLIRVTLDTLKWFSLHFVLLAIFNCFFFRCLFFHLLTFLLFFHILCQLFFSAFCLLTAFKLLNYIITHIFAIYFLIIKIKLSK